MRLSAEVPAFAEPDIHSLSRAPKGLHRRLSLCSLPVPKQSEGSLGSLISVAQSANCRTWQPARCVILFVIHDGLGRRSAVIFYKHECSLPAIDREEIRYHLPGHGKGRTIGVPFLLFLFIDQSQFMVLSGG